MIGNREIWSYKLDSNIPIYSETKRENFERRHEIIKIIIKKARITEELKIHVISNYLKDSGITTLLKFKRDKKEIDPRSLEAASKSALWVNGAHTHTSMSYPSLGQMENKKRKV